MEQPRGAWLPRSLRSSSCLFASSASGKRWMISSNSRQMILWNRCSRRRQQPRIGAHMDDQTYIQRTLELAEKGRGLTSPGAMVGAVIVKDGRIVGEGFYTYDGIRHAETIALEQARDAARGATVYTNLEP